MRHNTRDTEKEKAFMEAIGRYDGVVRRVCFMYAGPSDPFDDLYQETMVNLWRGLDSYRGEARLSTWIYRTTVNTCISCLRRNGRHASHSSLDEAITMVAGDDTQQQEMLRTMYTLISRLDPLEKAIVMMRLDEKSYDEIAAVTGLTRTNVATRLHRAKEKMKNLSQTY